MPRLLWAALAVVLVVCVGVTAAIQLDRAGKERGTSAPVSPEPRRRAPVVFVLGDSYTVGIRGLGPERAYAAGTARLLGWQVVVAGRARTGFANTGGTGETFASLFEKQLGWRPAPDMVVLSGGHNDVGIRPRRVVRASIRLVETVRSRWPGTQVVLMGPMWGGDPGPHALLVRDTLRTAAARLDVPFIDPLGGRWITGDPHRGTGNAGRLIRSDGTHPNTAGNRHIAQSLATELRRLGLARPALGETEVGHAGPDPADPSPGQAVPSPESTP